MLRSIPTGTLIGLRDPAIIGVLIYTAARPGAVARLRLADFYTAGRTDRLKATAMSGKDILRMVKRRFKAANLPPNLPRHTFRTTTITDLVEQGVNPDDVHFLAGHSDPRAARLYDRRRCQVTRNIVELIPV